MKKVIIAAFFTILCTSFVSAQQPQIPTIFLNNFTKLEGKGIIHVTSRRDLIKSGNFEVRVAASCTPPFYPTATLDVMIDMSDSSITSFTSTSVHAMSSTGKHTPMASFTGTCNVVSNMRITGCRYWIKIVDNSKFGDGTPDIVSFLVVDGNGKRIAYGSGPLRDGDFQIEPTSN